MIIDTYFSSGQKAAAASDIWSCSVVMRIKHLETPVATVVKETNGSHLKHKSVDQISGSTYRDV